MNTVSTVGAYCDCYAFSSSFLLQFVYATYVCISLDRIVLDSSDRSEIVHIFETAHFKKQPYSIFYLKKPPSDPSKICTSDLKFKISMLLAI